MRRSIGLLLILLSCTPATAQTAPETLAYIFFGVSVPPKSSDISRTEILKSTPNALQFAKFFTGQNKQYNVEVQNITIDQTSSCNFRISGKYKLGDDTIEMDNMLDFTNLSASNPPFVTEKRGPGLGDLHYYNIGGVKACARKGSFRNKHPYYQFPDENKCDDYVYTSNVFDNSDVERMTAAYHYFKQTYCKGRAF